MKNTFNIVLVEIKQIEMTAFVINGFEYSSKRLWNDKSLIQLFPIGCKIFVIISVQRQTEISYEMGSNFAKSWETISLQFHFMKHLH